MKDAKTFLDTNIIVYAYDVTAKRKRTIAQKIVEDLWKSGLGVLSTQVLQEFFVNVTRKLPKPIEALVARQIIGDFLQWDVVVNDGDALLRSVDIHMQYQYTFWDSLIIDAAARTGAELLLSEDLSHGQVIKGVTIQNPFL